MYDEEILDGFDYIPSLTDSCVANVPGERPCSSFLTVDPVYKFSEDIKSNLPCGYKLSVPSSINEFCSSTTSVTHDKALVTPSKSEIVNPKFEVTPTAYDNLLRKKATGQVSNSVSCSLPRKNRKLTTKILKEKLDDTKTVLQNEILNSSEENCLQMTSESGLEPSMVQNIEPLQFITDSKDTECDSSANMSSANFSCSSTSACSLIISQKVQSECKTDNKTDIVESQKANLRLTSSIDNLQDSNPESDVGSEANDLPVALLESNSVQSGESSASKAKHFKSLEKLSEQFKTLYLEGKYHDLTIIMEGREFRVHKSILSARSPVFSELLSQKAGESTIFIDPCDACNSDTFHSFLLYVYSGNIQNLLTENVCGLYYTADKYKFPELKEECVDFMKKSLSIETISDVVRLTIKNDEYELHEMATLFFARNLEAIIVTDKWQQFMIEDIAQAVNFHLKALKIGYTKTST